ncbi:WD40/YVTN/BNR-like repeat-containing protein [Pseudomonas syringae]|uniref:WD40/YVTN/BNR-like repeat-containing protein n=1 Tax=Pseudomonas syringae TaxID=317 RepID=UPI001EE74249|nr:YCF48-related protein [Pseudomonas syringae]
MALTALVTSLAVHADEAPVKPVLQRPALLISQPNHAVLIDIARAGERLVAVGEQGVIVLSDDDGKHWRQASVPVSVSLTSVSFPSALQGWAVGHAGSILHTVDGGENWTLQLDGNVAAQRVLDAVVGNAHASERQLKVAQRFVVDGADKPFLSVHFSNDRQGTAVGAFGLIMHTDDGGQTWQSWVERLDNPAGNHLYAVVSRGERIYVTGEQGVLFGSFDNGEHFKRLTTPYEGSFFAMNLAENGDLLLAGLRGNAWRTQDQGLHWQSLQNPMHVSLVAARVTNTGRVMLADQTGRLLLSSRDDNQLRVQEQSASSPVAALAQAADGRWVVAGAHGVRRLHVQGEKQ